MSIGRIEKGDKGQWGAIEKEKRGRSEGALNQRSSETSAPHNRDRVTPINAGTVGADDAVPLLSSCDSHWLAIFSCFLCPIFLFISFSIVPLQLVFVIL